MSIINIIKKVKEVHSESIALVKIGSFYHAYGRDAYILSYLFQYRLKQVEKNYITCGFPANSIEKVLSVLKENKIDYLILDKTNNYEIESQVRHESQNNYKLIYDKSRIYVNLKNRLDTIYNYLEECIFEEGIKDILTSIEDLIDEKIKI